MSKSKYDTILAEWLMSDCYNEADDTVGNSSDGVGWAGRWDDMGVIIHEAPDGSVTTVTVEPDGLTMRWADIVHELEPSEEPEEGDYVISPKLYVVPLMQEYSNLDKAMSDIASDMDRKNFWPNVWLQDDHGGFTNVSEDLPNRS